MDTLRELMDWSPDPADAAMNRPVADALRQGTLIGPKRHSRPNRAESTHFVNLARQDTAATGVVGQSDLMPGLAPA